MRTLTDECTAAVSVDEAFVDTRTPLQENSVHRQLLSAIKPRAYQDSVHKSSFGGYYFPVTIMQCPPRSGSIQYHEPIEAGSPP
ncbi:hypothetical protein [Salibacterium qingdaonense]|uniref:Uncharacterized protein n=1 Tax=Salibacterium qingdaonense TaxID=266892 RepID=A0A1I4PL32_9BACI|nr:hypothetical protein [Salibacterium qingdaonense]SFM28200.1 hypothetical protein SAMN04488054_1283 [Salibacterium qingdaonense]